MARGARMLGDRNLRRAQASFLLAWSGEWAFTVGLSVYAFRQGGAAAVGLVAMLRMLPSAFITPLAAPVADRVRRERVLIVSSLVRTAAIAAATGLAAAGAEAPVYVLAVVATVAGTLYRPVHSALLPSLCRTAGALADANVVRGFLDSVATLVGPLIAAVALAGGSVTAVFAAAALASALSAGVLARVRYEAPPRESQAAPPARRLGDVAVGLRAVVAERDVALLFGLAAAQTFTRGCVTVLSVVLAIELLDTGEAGVGVLTAAIGAGAVVGSLAVAALAARARLAAWFGLGVALWGAPLVVVGAVPSEAVAVALFACVGVGNALVDLGLFTLPARLLSDALLARAFTVLESVIALAVALGAILTPVAIDLLGARGALVAVGVVAPAFVALGWRRLALLDRRLELRDADVALLRRVGMLSPLPMPTIEHLARAMEHVDVAAGEVVFAQGMRGDTFYVIAAGEAMVLDGDRPVCLLTPGESFGEIALLRDVERTATVRARTAVHLCVLRRREFLGAVIGYSASRRESDTVILRRLEELALARARATEQVPL